MLISTIGLYIVGTFLLINLLLGLWAGKEVKDIRDYAIGNKKWSTGALVMTYLATVIGGGFIIRESMSIAIDGLSAFIMMLSTPLSHLFLVYCFKSKTSKFQNCITIGEFVGKFYEGKSQFIVGIFSAIYSIVVVALQIKILGSILSDFLGIDSTITTIFSGLIVGTYTAFGGMRSVIATDILQFIIIFGALSIIASFAINTAGGFTKIITELPNKFSTPCISNNFGTYLSVLLIDTIFLFEISGPAKFERLLMINGEKKLKKVLIYCAIGTTVAAIMIYIASISYVFIANGSDPSNNPISYLSNFVVPSVFKPILLIGLMAVVLSSGDSWLHSAGLSLSNDVIAYLCKKEIKLNIHRLIVFFISVVCIAVAIYGSSFLSNIKYVVACMAPIVCGPMLFIFCNFKTSKKMFYASTSVALTVFFIINFFIPSLKDFATLLSVISSIITLFIVHIAEYKDIIISKTDLTIKKIKKSSTINPLLHFVNFCEKKVELSGASFVLFGSFYLVSTLLQYLFFTQPDKFYEYQIFYVKAICTLLCSVLLTHSIWPKICKKYLPAFWYTTLAYCLSFLSTIMLILTHGAIEYTINIAINIMFLLLLVDWKSAIGIALVGLSAAIAYYKIFLQIDPSETILGFDTLYLLVYQIVFGSLIGLLFARKRHIKLQNIDTKADYLATLNYSILDTNQRANKIVEDSNKSHLGTELKPQENIDEIKNLLKSKNYEKISKQLENLETYVAAEAANISPYFVLNVNQIEISTLTEKCEKFCKAFGCEDISINIFTKKQKIQCDPIAIIKVLTKLISDYCKQAQANDEEDNIYINISVTDTVLSYSSAKTGNFIRIQDAINFTISDSESIDTELSKDLFEKTLTDPTKIPYTTFNDCEMIDIERTVDAHYGLLERSEDLETFAWACVLPVKVYDIRPITLDMSAPTTQDLSYEWPAADELEKAFIEKIKNSTQIRDQKNLIHAIEVIKIYHRHQSRKSGEPYYMHPISVAMIVIDLINEKDSTVYNLLQDNQETVILTALLHDILEDTYYKPKNLIQDFGPEVLRYVESVTKANYEARQYLLLNKEAFQALIDKEPITIVVKLADRLHNIMTIDGHPNEQKRRAVAEETLDFFIAPAQKLGFIDMAQRLDDASHYILSNGRLEGFWFGEGK